MATLYILYLQIILFFFLIATIFMPEGMSFFGRYSIMIAAILFSLLGAVLVVFVNREKVEGKVKKFLLLAGYSAVGFLISVILHNLLYTVAVVAKGIAFIHYPAEALHVIFFLASILICPVGFIIGFVGGLIYLSKRDKVTD